MSNRLIDILHTQVLDESDSTTNMTYRASRKTARMIELMSVVLNKPISNLFTVEISEKIVEILLKDTRNIQLLEDFLKTDFKLNGSLKILNDRDLIEQDLTDVLKALNLH